MSLAGPLLEVAGLSVDIPVAGGILHAVRDVSFSVRRGETFCLVGESGCGKTMTSLALMRLLPRSSALRADRLIFEGINIANLSEKNMSAIRGSRIGMIFQDPMTSLNPVYTIGNQMTEGYLRHRGGGSRAAYTRAEYLLARLGVTSPKLRLSQYPHELSGGLRQRVMIAMTLMCEPTLIIADEPTTALDVTVQAQILRLLRDLQREFGMALILITHDLGIVARIADRVAVMYAGQIAETADTPSIFARPTHPYTQGLLACIPGTAGTGRLGSIPGVVPSLIGDREGCAFANRCRNAMPPCRMNEIQLSGVSRDHLARCLLIQTEGTVRSESAALS